MDDETPAEKRRKSTEKAILRFYKKQIPKTRKKRLDVPYEWEEARDFVQWMEAKGIGFTHVPNEGKRSGRVGRNLFKEGGGQKGFPDFLIFWPRPPDGSPGIAIELKRQKYHSHPREQKEWLALFEKWGWKASFAHGADEAIALVSDWLELPKSS